ncbi:MAG: hypothetical protein CMH49_09415 [Myxococcales bacterium]|nr:hypothetical protein [Myxococcales bacterium]
MSPNLSPLNVPDLVNLQCFVALSKSLSFKESAASVALSPAAFSDRIRKLEEQLGSALFERTTRRVKLTQFGTQLLPHAQELLNSAARWVEATNLEGIQVPYAIRLGTRFELGMSWIVPSLNLLKSMNTQRTISLKWGTDQELLRMLNRGEIDALISSVRVRQRSLNILALHREDYVLVSAPSLNLGNLKAQEASQLVLIDTEEELPLFRYFSESLPNGEPWLFKGYELMGTIAAVRSRVLEGVGIAVLPLYFVKDDLEIGALTSIAVNHTLKHDFFRLIWREDLIYKTALSELANDLQTVPLA